MKRLILSLLFVPVLALASDQYVFPGGVDHPLYHWQYPDIATMQGDTGFFNQDLGKVAFIPNLLNVGAGSTWRLGAAIGSAPTWAWAGGDPLRFDGVTNFSYINNQNGKSLFNLQNGSLGTQALIGLQLIGGDTIFHIAAYIPGFTGLPLDGEPWSGDGVTITNTRGRIILNPSDVTELSISDGATNTIAPLATFRHYSSGLTVAGFGVGARWSATNSTGAVVDIGGMDAEYISVGTFPSSKLHFKLVDSGSFGDEMTLSNSELTVLVPVNTLVGFKVGGTNLKDVAETLNNKRVNPRTNSIASTASLTVNADALDRQSVTALAVNMTINAPTGTPVDGQMLKFYINDNGVSRTLTWNVIFTNSPVAATGIKKNIIEFEWNAANSAWEKVIAQQF